MKGILSFVYLFLKICVFSCSVKCCFLSAKDSVVKFECRKKDEHVAGFGVLMRDVTDKKMIETHHLYFKMSLLPTKIHSTKRIQGFLNSFLKLFLIIK